MANNEEQNQFFQKLLHDYLSVENELKMLNEALRKRKDKKKNLGESILAFIKKNEINKINLDGDFKGHQLCEKITKTQNISKDEIMNIFYSFQQVGVTVIISSHEIPSTQMKYKELHISKGSLNNVPLLT